MKRKEPELQNLQHQISSLENRLTFSKKDREVTVSEMLLRKVKSGHTRGNIVAGKHFRQPYFLVHGSVFS